MNRVKIAGELVKIAKELSAVRPRVVFVNFSFAIDSLKEAREYLGKLLNELRKNGNPKEEIAIIEKVLSQVETSISVVKLVARK